MITNKEIQACKLSATKKDFYQIWNELLDTATKLSERWHPNSTTESDPGIVLLKVLTGIADKLNYNIDKNILEAYLPSAAQEESMRKLTEMLGYNMKYYQSAQTDITISYSGTALYNSSTGFTTTINFPKYLSITNSDNDINYITTEAVKFTEGSTIKILTVPAIEGQLCQCESGEAIDLTYIDSKNRYFLPENVIAENGIFVTSADGQTTWEKVDNLNTQELNKKCYQFGYDSIKGAPYIKFPSDISSLIGDGLLISYVRTNGVNGNISARTLTTFNNYEDITADDDTVTFTSSDFTIYNLSAVKNGADNETLTDAYNSFKKTVGTFETLVTCRDYMNKIYQLTDSNNNPYCSNIIVSDIRDDINRSVVVAGFNEYGICYNCQSKVADTKDYEFTYTNTDTSQTTGINISMFPFASYKSKLFTGTTINYTETITGTGKSGYFVAYITYTYDSTGDPNGWDTANCSFVEITETYKIDNFDLVFYPFKTLKGAYIKQNYINSFKYTDANLESIKAELEDYKTIAHDIKTPEPSELVCVKNYLKLNARITTTYKVNTAEQSAIRTNIFQKIYEKFNCREIDFGEEIPYDTILETIENADERIKYVILDEPDLYTKFLAADGEEYALVEPDDITTENYHGNYYNNVLALRNILSGKVELFNYNEDFEATVHEGEVSGFSLVYPNNTTDKIVKLESEFKLSNIPTGTALNEITLADNEQILFRAPNYRTKITYPCYVNYYFKQASTTSDASIPATLQLLTTFLDADTTWAKWNYIANNLANIMGAIIKITVASAADLAVANETYGKVFVLNGTTYEVNDAAWAAGTDYFVINIKSAAGWSSYEAYIQSCMGAHGQKLKGLYVISGTSIIQNGYLKNNYTVYSKSNKYNADYSIKNYYVQETYTSKTTAHTVDGLGENATLNGITKNAEYRLVTGDYLYINYTPSSDDDTTQAAVNLVYSEGTIIRPNFELKDSGNVHTSEGKSWSKTSGFDKTLFNNIDGMYCLGTTEQIEIREQVQVLFPAKDSSSATYNFYFNLNDEKADDDGNINFFDDSSVSSTTTSTSRVLEDGEYFYYTDANKLEMAYYGNGTEIKRTFTAGSAFNITKKATDDENITAEAIAEATSVMEVIPWIKMTLSETTKALTINEYQYVTLNTGDKLTKIPVSTISNNWDDCGDGSGVEFVYGADTSSETSGNLPIINITDVKWQVRSRLNFNIGPDTIQTLRCYKNTSTSALEISDTAKIIYDTGTGPAVAPTTSGAVISLKSNYEVVRESDSVDVSITEIKDGKSTPINDFKLKVFKQNDITTATGEKIVLSHDVGEHWSKLESAKIAVSDVSKLQVAFDSSIQYALLAIYFTGKTDDTLTTEIARKKDSIGLKVDDGTSYVYQYLTLCNAPSTFTHSWWPNYQFDDPLCNYLRNGLNIIKIIQPCSIALARDSTYEQTNANLIISDLRIVDIGDTDGIDLATIDYRPTESYSSSSWKAPTVAKLLAEINKLDPDHKFYYSIPIENNTAVEINTYNEEKLSDPLKWYDYNNANNKFVISEIDAEHLSTGIQIVRSSKL